MNEPKKDSFSPDRLQPTMAERCTVVCAAPMNLLKKTIGGFLDMPSFHMIIFKSVFVL
jgi:hypothetical protein